MPKLRQTPVTFDEWLGYVVEAEAKSHGGRPYLAELLPWSENTVGRRIRGEAPFLVSELEVIARALGTTPAELVEAALKRYGGLEKLVEESGQE